MIKKLSKIYSEIDKSSLQMQHTSSYPELSANEIQNLESNGEKCINSILDSLVPIVSKLILAP